MTRKPTPSTHNQRKRRRRTKDWVRSPELSQLEMAYAELTSDIDREAEAAEWCEAFADNALDA